MERQHSESWFLLPFWFKCRSHTQVACFLFCWNTIKSAKTATLTHKLHLSVGCWGKFGFEIKVIAEDPRNAFMSSL